MNNDAQNYYDFPSLKEVLEKLQNTQCITLNVSFEEIEKALVPLDVGMISGVTCLGPTRSPGEIAEHLAHEQDRGG